MSKWLDKLMESNTKAINKRIAKLEHEYREYRIEYNDYPYDRYQKAMDRREEEIEELKKAADPRELLREVEDWKESNDYLKDVMAKIYYLTMHIDVADQKSERNIIKLQTIINNYQSGNVDEEFKRKAEMGIW